MPITQVYDPRTLTDQVVLACDRCNYVQSYRADPYLTADPTDRLETFLRDHHWSQVYDRILCPAHTIKHAMLRDTAMSGFEYRMLQERYKHETRTAQADRSYSTYSPAQAALGGIIAAQVPPSLPRKPEVQYAQGMARGFYNGKSAGPFPGYMQVLENAFSTAS